MKILWMSDSPSAPSGYGNATRYICAGLAKLGHLVSIIGWQTRSATRWRSCRLYPVGEHDFGADVLKDHLRRIKPDVLITQGDFWRLAYIANPAVFAIRQEAGIPWATFYTLDSDRGENC